MKIDTRAWAAIGAILDVAIHGSNRPVRLSDISTRRGVSLSYLEQIFRKLRRGGLVVSIRGPGGGYQLARQLATVTVADVIAAVDVSGKGRGSSRTVSWQSGVEKVTAEKLWSGLDDYLQGYLRRVSLESVLMGTVEPADWLDREYVVVMDSLQASLRRSAALGSNTSHPAGP